jgi:hypothetical protein
LVRYMFESSSYGSSVASLRLGFAPGDNSTLSARVGGADKLSIARMAQEGSNGAPPTWFLDQIVNGGTVKALFFKIKREIR